MRNLCSHLFVKFHHVGDSLIYVILQMAGGEDKQLRTKGAEGADEFVVFHAVDGVKGPLLQQRVLRAQFPLGLAPDGGLRAVDGLRVDVVPRQIVCPEDDVLHGCPLVVGDAYDIFVSFVEIHLTLTVLFCRQGSNLIETIKGKVKDFVIVVCRTDEIPAVVILLQHVGMERDCTGAGIVEYMVIQLDDHAVGDAVEERAQKVGIVQIGVVAERDYLWTLLERKSVSEGLKPFKMSQSLELSQGIQELRQ